MTENCEQLLDKVLDLKPAERAHVAEKLLESLDNLSRTAIDTLWALEAEERIEAYERGDIKAISAREVFKNIKAEKKNED